MKARSTALLAMLVFLAGCAPWMQQDVRLPDGRTVVKLTHEWDGRFRTIVETPKGVVETQVLEQDSRHANLYLSPRARLVVADYGQAPDVFDIGVGRKPLLVRGRELISEFADAARWRYLGVVRRTGNKLEYFRTEAECQKWANQWPDSTMAQPKRAERPCAGSMI